MARIHTSNWTASQEHQVWNPDYAFAYGCLAVGRDNEEIAYAASRYAEARLIPSSCAARGTVSSSRSSFERVVFQFDSRPSEELCRIRTCRPRCTRL